MEIANLVEKQRRYFGTGKTLNYQFRVEALRRLKASILRHETDILQALEIDLGKSAYESYMTEVGVVLSELRYMERHLEKLMKAKKVLPSLSQIPAKCFIVKEPYGVVLILSPWNYPFMLALEPFIGAIAAGNCCIIKPSAYAKTVSRVMKKIIRETFPEAYACVVEGGRRENSALLEERFDYIFFTGGVTVGKLVMKKAAKYLTPVTLELGGKSPCIVTADADIKLSAKRIVFGKFLNSGQTCVAPDYVLVDEAVCEELFWYLKRWIVKMYGKEPLENVNYPKLVNEKHFDRVTNLMKGEEIVWGGKGKREELKIEPTILRKVKPDAPIMREEIFGPVLPILTYHEIEEAFQFVREREKPLACYLFTKDKRIEKKVLEKLSFGGGCINDTIMHLASSNLPFGGVGNSGMGSYHGEKSFSTFSHEKSIVKRGSFPDVPIRYQPYYSLKERLLRKFM